MGVIKRRWKGGGEREREREREGERSAKDSN
jgi:hypothetical protein